MNSWKEGNKIRQQIQSQLWVSIAYPAVFIPSKKRKGTKSLSWRVHHIISWKLIIGLGRFHPLSAVSAA